MNYKRFSPLAAAWDLQISGVVMSDDGLYQCQVGGTTDVEPIASDAVRLMVNVETSKPMILQGEDVEVVEGREEVLQCMAEGRPIPEVSFQTMTFTPLLNW